MDELSYDLDRKSVFYNKKNEIDLNYELKEGTSEILSLNMQFMLKISVENRVETSTTTKTLEATTKKQSTLKHGTFIKSTHVYAYLIP